MTDVIVVGAGLAGLTCARELGSHGADVLVLERGDQPGGRVRTDEVDGFLLDRGFQVLLTAYPEARHVLDYERLGLRPFYSGALVRQAEASRASRTRSATRSTPRGACVPAREGCSTRLRVARLRRRLAAHSLNEVLTRPQVTTREALRLEGFSAGIVDGFFRPFLGGIFLDPALDTSSRLFAFVFKLFAEGEAVLPAQGMQAIPRQLAEGLPERTLRLGATVETADGSGVTLAGGERLEAGAVVVAADGPEAAAAHRRPAGAGRPGRHLRVLRGRTLAARRAGLVLNGEGPAAGPSTTCACRATWRRATRRRARR